MKKLKLLNKKVFRKKMQKTPEKLNLKGIESNKCTNNSKLIIENNTDFQIFYVEGFIVVTEENKERAVAHAWNRIENYDFDVSANLVNNSNYKNEYIIEYFPFFEYTIEELPEDINGVLPFSKIFEPYIIEAKKKYPTVGYVK